MASTPYRGFKYVQVSAGLWRITLPSGLKSQVEATSEEEVKAKIDAVVGAGDGG